MPHPRPSRVNYEDSICSQQNLVNLKVVSRYVAKQIYDSTINNDVTVKLSDFSQNNGIIQIFTNFSVKHPGDLSIRL